MRTNFDFLHKNERFAAFAEAAVSAERALLISPGLAVAASRIAMEVAVKWMYSVDDYLSLPYDERLVTLISGDKFKDLLPPGMISKLDYLRKTGNRANHNPKNIDRNQAILALENLHSFLDFIPGHGQVLLKIKSGGICGSDLKYIYYTHNGTGGARYDNVIAGHEPCGQIVKLGQGTGDFAVGDRVVVYHIQGCGLCQECRKGFMIGCTSDERRAYGWQRDGAFAEYMLADVSTLIHLPDFLSYDDGAMVACGFGTAFQGLLRANVSGLDHVLVMGLGPVGQATVMLAKAMGATVIAADIVAERNEMAKKVGADYSFISDENLLAAIKEVTNGQGVEVAIDCSGNPTGRHLCLEAARLWGNVVFLGEQGTVSFEPSPLLLHKQLTLHGSWVTSLDNMRKVVDLLASKKLHPEEIITHRFPLADAQEAFRQFASGKTGKVVISDEA